MREVSSQVALEHSQGWSHHTRSRQDASSIPSPQGTSLLPHLGCRVLTLRQDREAGREFHPRKDDLLLCLV